MYKKVDKNDMGSVTWPKIGPNSDVINGADRELEINGCNEEQGAAMFAPSSQKTNRNHKQERSKFLAASSKISDLWKTKPLTKRQ